MNADAEAEEKRLMGYLERNAEEKAAAEARRQAAEEAARMVAEEEAVRKGGEEEVVEPHLHPPLAAAAEGGSQGEQSKLRDLLLGVDVDPRGNAPLRPLGP